MTLELLRREKGADKEGSIILLVVWRWRKLGVWEESGPGLTTRQVKDTLRKDQKGFLGLPIG